MDAATCPLFNDIYKDKSLDLGVNGCLWMFGEGHVWMDMLAGISGGILALMNTMNQAPAS